jgi:hypothetical protein
MASPAARDVDPHLVRSLRMLGDRYGPLGVALAAAALTDPAALVRQLTATPTERSAWAEPVPELLDHCGICSRGSIEPHCHCPEHQAAYAARQQQWRAAPPLDTFTPVPERRDG